MTVLKEHYTCLEAKERGVESCERVIEMFKERPWVKGEITETEKNGREDKQGIDLYVPVDARLTDILCLERNQKGIMVQVKSSVKREYEFKTGHKSKIFNLSTGQNIFVINGQDEDSLILGSLVGQMVAVAGLTGSVKEDVFLGFLAENLGDSTAVEAYMENRERIIREKWFAEWMLGIRFTHRP